MVLFMFLSVQLRKTKPQLRWARDHTTLLLSNEKEFMDKKLYGLQPLYELGPFFWLFIFLANENGIRLRVLIFLKIFYNNIYR